MSDKTTADQPATDEQQASEDVRQPVRRPRHATAECLVEDCQRTPTIRGLCDAHWASRRGDAERSTK